MKNAFLKYSLFFLILLLSGFQGVYAYSYPDVGNSTTLNSSFNVFSPIAKVDNTYQGGRAEIDFRPRLLAEVTETEEEAKGNEEVDFASKKIELGGFLTVFFYIQLCAQLLSVLQQNLRRHKPFFLKAPFRRYVRFQVLRI